MAACKFADAVKQKPYFKTKLRDSCGGYVYCEISFYSWAKGTVIKIEGVNLKAGENTRLVFENAGEYICNPCKNGYLFEVFFSDTLSGEISENMKIYLMSGADVIASNERDNK